MRRPQAWCARRSGALVWACPSAVTPAGASGSGRWRARCAGPAASPSPAFRSLLGEWGRPLGFGGAEGCSCGPQARGGERGGGCGGGVPPSRLASACHLLSPACPPGVYPCRGGGRASAAVGRGPIGRQCVSVAGGGGGDPPALVRTPVVPRPDSEGAAPFAPSWAPPVRRRPAAGRAGACGRFIGGACRGRGAPSPRVQRALRGGCGAAVASVCLCPLLGLRGTGGGGGCGRPLVPWCRPLTAEGRRPGGPSPGGQPSAGGSHSSPAPLYLESGPRAGPRRGPSSPPSS